MATLGQLLGENKFLKLQSNNKILCDVTGHEMSARADVVQAYISGKKFKKELEWYKHDYSEFLPYIVEDKRNSKKLFCKLTKQTLNRIPEEVRKHMQGKRFKRLVEEEKQKPAKETKKKAAVNKNESDDEESLDPRIVKELLGEVSDAEEEEVPAKASKTKRAVAKQDDNMSDLLGSDIEEGDDVSMGSDEEEDSDVEDDEDEEEPESENENENDSEDDASSKEDARFNKKGTRVSEKKVLLAQGKKPSKHSARGPKGKVVKAKSNGKAGAKGGKGTSPNAKQGKKRS